MYLDSLSFGFFPQSSLVLFVFHHSIMESFDIFFSPGTILLFFLSQLFLNFLNKQTIQLVFSLLLLFFTLILIFYLFIPHFFLLLNFSFILFFLFFLSLVISLNLLILKLFVFHLFVLFHLSSSLFLFKLLIKLPFHFLLELLLPNFLKFFLFFEKFSVKLNQSSPFIVIISFYMIN